MNEHKTISQVHALSGWFKDIQECTIATSGGIDSMVLAYVAHRAIHHKALIAHAVSAAVPTLDAARVARYAETYSWNITLLPAGEMDNETYRNNPINRCYYCKRTLFEQLTQLQHGVIVTGTNHDDLGDYRPGLMAAQEQGVRQPYVELGIDKNTIRQIAHYFELNDIKDIPASPCLSSRVETGIYIMPEYLLAIDAIENFTRNTLHTDIVRFRIRNENVELELSLDMLNNLSEEQRLLIEKKITTVIRPLALPQKITLAAYTRGSAFVGRKTLG